MGISDEISESRDDRHLCHLSDEATISDDSMVISVKFDNDGKQNY